MNLKEVLSHNKKEINRLGYKYWLIFPLIPLALIWTVLYKIEKLLFYSVFNKLNNWFSKIDKKLKDLHEKHYVDKTKQCCGRCDGVNDFCISDQDYRK